MIIPNQYKNENYTQSGKYYSGYTVPSKPELNDVQKRLIERMQRNRMKIWESYSAYEQAPEADKKPDNYFPTKSGWGVARKRVLNGNTVEFVGKAKDCPIAEEIKEQVFITIENKIPGALLQEILANFNKVNIDSGNECAAQIYRERTGDQKYFIYYPEQKVSSAQVKYTDDPKLMDLAKEYDLIMELHSHDNMGAFWSDTDDNNETTCGFYMVIGRFNMPKVEYKCRVKFEKIYADFDCSEIFDFGEATEDQILTRANFIAATDELDKKITKEAAYTYTGYGQHYSSLWEYGDYAGYGYGYGYSKTHKRNKTQSYMDHTEIAARKRLMDTLKDAPDVIPAGDRRYDQLWDHAEFIETRSRWESCGYYDPQESSNLCWKRIQKKNQPGAEGEVSPDAVVATDYVKRISKAYSKEGFEKRVPSGGVANGLETADYLAGNGDEAAARYGVLPGKLEQYNNFGLDLGVADVNDKDYNDALNMAVASRSHTQSNLEAFLKEGIGGVREETENKFVANVMNAAFLHTPSASINLGIFWELLTPMEKTRLAKAFHCSVLDLTQLMLGGLAVQVPSDVSEFLYKCILGDKKYVEAKLGLITTKVMAEKPTSAAQFVAVIHEMLSLGTENEDDAKEEENK